MTAYDIYQIVIYAYVPIAVWLTHFIADFLFQTDWMALNKSKDWQALAAHVTVYSLCFVWCPHPLIFVGVTWVTHFLTDALTSRATSALWFFHRDPLDGCDPPMRWEWRYIPGRRHWFFVMIGLDQLIHAVTLGLTWMYVTS